MTTRRKFIRSGQVLTEIKSSLTVDPPDRALRLLLQMYTGLVLFMFVLSVGLYWFLPPQIPLWFSRPTDSRQLASRINLFLLVALIVFSYVFNRFLLRKLADDLKLLSFMLAGAGLVMSSLLLIVMVHLVLLVI